MKLSAHPCTMRCAPPPARRARVAPAAATGSASPVGAGQASALAHGAGPTLVRSWTGRRWVVYAPSGSGLREFPANEAGPHGPRVGGRLERGETRRPRLPAFAFARETLPCGAVCVGGQGARTGSRCRRSLEPSVRHRIGEHGLCGSPQGRRPFGDPTRQQADVVDVDVVVGPGPPTHHMVQQDRL